MITVAWTKLNIRLPQTQVIGLWQWFIWIYIIPAANSNQLRWLKKIPSFQQAARLFPTRRNFNKSVLPINMSWRWPWGVTKCSYQINDKSLQFEATQEKRTALFRVITQRVVVTPFRRFGTTYQSHLQGPRNQKKKRWEGESSSHLLRGRSLKSRITQENTKHKN